MKTEEERAVSKSTAQQKKKKHDRKKLPLLVLLLLLIAVGCGCAAVFYLLPQKQYRDAVRLLQMGRYTEASDAFAALGRFRDAETRVKEAAYLQAEALLGEGRLDEASAAFASLGDFKDSAQRRWMPYAGQAESLLEDGDFDGAREAFMALYERSFHTYASAGEMAMECSYRKAAALEADGQEDDALAVYETIPDYRDSLRKQQSIHLAKGMSALETMDLKTARKEFTSCEPSAEISEQLTFLNTYEAADTALKSNDFPKARDLFRSLGDYLDAREQAENCDAAEYSAAEDYFTGGETAAAYALFDDLGDYEDSQARAEWISVSYDTANQLLDDGAFHEAIVAFLALHDYADSPDKAKEAWYRQAQSEEKAGNPDAALAVYEELGDYRDCPEKVLAARKAKAEASVPDGKKLDGYERADRLFGNGFYAEAAEQFKLLKDEKDSADRAKEAVYQFGLQQMALKKYGAARAAFSEIPDFRYTASLIRACSYQTALAKMEAGDFADAAWRFDTLGRYADSAVQRNECWYRKGLADEDSGDYEEAQKAFAAVPGYKDSDDRRTACLYSQAEALRDAGQFLKAQARYRELGEYEDSPVQAAACVKAQADFLFDIGNYAGAEEYYKRIADLKDSADRVKECRLRQGKACIRAKNYEGALSFLEDLDYADSEALAGQCWCTMGFAAHEEGDEEEAIRRYSKAASYPGIAALLFDLGSAYAMEGQNEKAIETLWACGDYEPAKAKTLELAGLLKQNGEPEDALVAYYSAGNREEPSLMISADGNPDLPAVLKDYTIFTDGSFSDKIIYEHADTLIPIDADASLDLFTSIHHYSDVEEVLLTNAELQSAADAKVSAADGFFYNYEYQKAYLAYRAARIAGKPVEDRRRQCRLLAFLTEPGRKVTFGQYPQESADVPDPVVWRFACVEEGNLVFITDKLLEYAAHETGSGKNKSDLVARWLSNSRTTMFSQGERRSIVIFDIPSKSQMEQYVPAAEDRIAQPTAYALEVKDTTAEGNKKSSAWLSSFDDYINETPVYSVYNPSTGRISSYGDLAVNWEYLRPYLSLRADEDLITLFTNGSYVFYDANDEIVPFSMEEE